MYGSDWPVVARVGGILPRQLLADLRWEARALRVRVTTALRAPDLGSGPFRLNVGAGEQRVPGWMTVDVDGVDIVADVRWRIPLADGSCEAIFSEHTLEHFRFDDEAPGFLRECFRLLAPGAPIRVSVPDASLYLRTTCRGTSRSSRPSTASRARRC